MYLLGLPLLKTEARFYSGPNIFTGAIARSRLAAERRWALSEPLELEEQWAGF